MLSIVLNVVQKKKVGASVTIGSSGMPVFREAGV